MDRIIPVAVSTDMNYCTPTYITLHSMLKYSKTQDFYKIYVLIEKSFDINYQSLLKSLEEEYNNVEILFEQLGDSFKDSKMIIQHTTTPSMYRLLLPELLSQYDKCIYIDVDTLVCDDISSLYDIDIYNYYVGGVRDIEADDYIRKFDYSDIVPPTDEYINTGLLLMNLKKMRDEKVINSFIRISKSRLLFMDQDILNIVCYGKIYFLPLRYNAMVKYRFIHYRQKRYQDNVTKYFSCGEIHEAYHKPVVIHYAQPTKPWQCKYIYEGGKWFKYINANISKDVKKKYITPFIMANKKKFAFQINYFIRYLLYKLGIFKYVLKIKGII